MLGDYNCHVNESSEQTIDVERVYVHSHYRSNKHLNDIALIKLAHEVNVSNGNVTPACLPGYGLNPTFSSGDGCYVTGWGETKGKNTNVSQLNETRSPCRAA